MLLLRSHGHVFVLGYMGFEATHRHTRLEVPQAKHPVGATGHDVATVPEIDPGNGIDIEREEKDGEKVD